MRFTYDDELIERATAASLPVLSPEASSNP